MNLIKPYESRKKIVGDIKFRQTERTNCVVYTLAHLFGETFLKYRRPPEEYFKGGHNHNDVTNFLNKEKDYLKNYVNDNIEPVFWFANTIVDTHTDTLHGLPKTTIHEALWFYGYDEKDEIQAWQLSVGSQRKPLGRHGVLLLWDGKKKYHNECYILIDSVHQKMYRATLYDIYRMYGKIYGVESVCFYYKNSDDDLKSRHIFHTKEQLSHLNIDWNRYVD